MLAGAAVSKNLPIKSDISCLSLGGSFSDTNDFSLVERSDSGASGLIQREGRIWSSCIYLCSRPCKRRPRPCQIYRRVLVFSCRQAAFPLHIHRDRPVARGLHPSRNLSACNLNSPMPFFWVSLTAIYSNLLKCKWFFGIRAHGARSPGGTSQQTGARTPTGSQSQSNNANVLTPFLQAQQLQQK